MKLKFEKWYSALMSALFSMLGFSSCDNISNRPVCEYGCPTVEYKIGGIVTDSSTGAPVEGVKARLEQFSFSEEDGWTSYRRDSVVTDEKGTFAFNTHSDNPGVIETEGKEEKEGLAVVFEDMDGKENGGAYENDTVWLKDMEKEQTEKGDGRWMEGSYYLTANGKMAKKK